jgi:hypothetical protein
LEADGENTGLAERCEGALVVRRKSRPNLFFKYTMGGLLIASLVGGCVDEPAVQQVETPTEMSEEELTIPMEGTDSNENVAVYLQLDQTLTPDEINELENLGVKQAQLEDFTSNGTEKEFVEAIIPVENATKIAELDYVSDILPEEPELGVAPPSVAGGGR